MKISYAFIYNMFFLISGLSLTLIFSNAWFLLIWFLPVFVDVDE